MAWITTATASQRLNRGAFTSLDLESFIEGIWYQLIGKTLDKRAQSTPRSISLLAARGLKDDSPAADEVKRNRS